MITERQKVVIRELAELDQQIAELSDYPYELGNSDLVQRLVAAICDLYDCRDKLERRIAGR